MTVLKQLVLPCLLAIFFVAAPAAHAVDAGNPIVRLITSEGDIDIELNLAIAPAPA